MIGLGIDLCDIERMETILIKTPSFLSRYFTADEQAYLSTKHKMTASSMAGMFAAKEAFLKALGVGLGSVSLSDIGVTHDASGAPLYALTESAKDAMDAKSAKHAFLSITHEKGMAAAVCILE